MKFQDNYKTTKIFILIILIIIFIITILFSLKIQNNVNNTSQENINSNGRQEKVENKTNSIFGDLLEKNIEINDDTVNKVPSSYIIPLKKHTYQTFNNCGPATLSMLLSYQDVSVGQDELGKKMRPYQNTTGDNDDKTVFTYEFTDWVNNYGNDYQVKAINLPNGNIELLKKFISSDIPVVVKIWLNAKEDIGHFALIRGYDDSKQIVIKDDSYYGPN